MFGLLISREKRLQIEEMISYLFAVEFYLRREMMIPELIEEEVIRAFSSRIAVEGEELIFEFQQEYLNYGNAPIEYFNFLLDNEMIDNRYERMQLKEALCFIPDQFIEMAG